MGSPIIVTSGKHSGKTGIVGGIKGMAVRMLEDVTLIEVNSLQHTE